MNHIIAHLKTRPKARGEPRPFFIMDEIDWQMVEIEALCGEQLSPDAMEDVIANARMLFRSDTAPTQLVVAAAKAVLALLLSRPSESPRQLTVGQRGINTFQTGEIS